jgi:hypothetical protein
MSIITIIAVGIVAGLLYIYKSIKQAEEDPENFDHYKDDPKFRKPDDWKTGSLPSSMEKKNKNLKKNSRFDFSLLPLSYN